MVRFLSTLLSSGILLSAMAVAQDRTTPATPAQMPAGTGSAGAGSASAGSSTGAGPAGSGSRTCKVTNSPPSPGENQLSADDNAAAEITFRAALAQDPSSVEAHLGLVRALLGQDRVHDAQLEVDHLLHDHPGNAVAETAASEAAYRAGDLDAALAHAEAGNKDDPCEARAYAAYAAVLDLNGYFASEAHYLKQAHSLRPNDEQIKRSWLQLLPRKQREEELSRYLDGPHALSPDDARGFDNELAHLKARRTGECHVSSTAESTHIALQPIFGDRTYPVAFGLDVSFNNTRRRMQIDTGASGIVLTQSAARALKLDPEYQLKTGGVGDEGKLNSYLAHVHSIRIGDVEVTDCMVEVVSKSKLDVDGLIGMDVFSRWVVTLDYADAQLQLSPLPARLASSGETDAAKMKPALDDTGDEGIPKDRYIAPEMKNWGRIIRIGHTILLPAFFHPEGQSKVPHFLIMDTGASMTSLSSTMARESGKLHGSDMQFVGLSGKVNKVYETDLASVAVANMVLPTARYYAYDMTGLSHSTGLEISGLLGLPTLQRLTIKIDYRDNLLKLSYDPKHDVARFQPGSN